MMTTSISFVRAAAGAITASIRIVDAAVVRALQLGLEFERFHDDVDDLDQEDYEKVQQVDEVHPAVLPPGVGRDFGGDEDEVEDPVESLRRAVITI
jgi:hypothetical protein